MKEIRILVADASHEKYVDEILDTIREAAKKRGTGIAERTHEYVATKMIEGKAVIALMRMTALRGSVTSRLGATNSM